MIRTWICRLLRLGLATSVAAFVGLCGLLWGEMDVFSRVVTSGMALLVAAVILALVVLIARFCGAGGCIVHFRRHVLLWALSIAFTLALSIVLPSVGMTLYQVSPPDGSGSHSEHHSGWDWD